MSLQREKKGVLNLQRINATLILAHGILSLKENNLQTTKEIIYGLLISVNASIECNVIGKVHH